jgi:hypothetical protein
MRELRGRSSRSARFGRRRTLDSRSNVGNLSGGEHNMDVLASRRDRDIATTSHSAGPLSPAKRRDVADDRR